MFSSFFIRIKKFKIQKKIEKNKPEDLNKFKVTPEIESPSTEVTWPVTSYPEIIMSSLISTLPHPNATSTESFILKN